MVEIKLDKKENENYTSGDANISIKKEDYGNQKKFEKVTYEINYKNKYDSYWFWLWSSSYYTVSIKNKNDIIFTYYASKDLDVLERVESYHSVKHPDFPLILGLKNKYYTKYYTYFYLKSKSKSTGFPDKWFESDRSDEKLKTRLKAEDNRVNRIKFFNTNNGYKNCKEEIKDVKGNRSVKYFYTAVDKNRYDDHVLTRKELFSREQNIQVNDSYFKSVENQYYDEVNVYCTNEQIKRVLLLEFINGNTKTYFSRQDKNGHYWINKKVTDLNTELTKIDDDYRNKLTYLIGRKRGYNGVNVYRENEITSFDKYKHTPDYGSSNKTSLLYKGNKIELETNEQFTGGKINNIQKLSLSSVCTYFIQGSNNTSPVFIELTEKTPTNNYWLQKVNPNGLLWKQISDPKLNDAIAYRLELKNIGFYGNNSIQVSPVSDKKFDAYYHKLQSGYDKKKCFVCYRSNLITLTTIDSIQDDKRLNNIHNKTYSFIKIFYAKSTDVQSEKIDLTIPICLELTESGTSNKSYTLFRIDKEGIIWTQINITSQDLGREDSTRQEKIKQLNYHTSKSIVILATKNDGEYSVNIVDNSVSTTIRPIPYPDPSKKITIKEQKCEASTSYKSYNHVIPSMTVKRGETNPLSEVTAVRLFMASNSGDSIAINNKFEIKIFDEANKNITYLYFDPLQNTSKLYLYFHHSNKVPLMFQYSGLFYKPNSLDDYFKGWKQISNFRLYNFCDNSNKQEIERELNKISTNLNQINIKNTNESGYGLFDTTTVSIPKGFDGKLINVKHEHKNGLYKKLIHTPLNKVGISKVKFNNEELKGDEKRFIVGSTNSVWVYYHNSDSKYRYPLLIYLSGGGSRYEFFYERERSNSDINWKKVDGSELDTLKKEDDKLVDKINTIHYTIGKSIIVQVDHQPDQGGSGNYNVQLVDNKEGTSDPTPASGEITVKKGECTPTQAPPTGYVCFKHQIPDLTKLSASQYVSGLRLYACDKYLETRTSTGSLPIYYDTNHTQVKVYFYQGNSANTDKVPLLVEYEGTYFKPSSRDDYFKSWIKAEIPQGDGRGDLGGLSQIGNVLDGINKDLNTLELDKTGNGADNDKYGITPPKNSEGICTNGTGTPVKDFCNRVTVQRNGGEGAGYYLKVTHKTFNKGPIGAFMYQGEKIGGIKVDENMACNKVDVYYRANDRDYSQPLLIHINSQSPESSSTCTGKWFSRQGIDVKVWNDADTKDGKFDSDSSIQAYLEKIQTKLSNYLLLSIESHKPYSAYVQKGSEGDKIPMKEISVNAGVGADTYKPENYRFYIHGLSKYYGTNKADIVSQLSLDSQEPTLQVRLYIFNNYSLGLYDKDGINILSTPLTYGKENASSESDDPYVYFFEPLDGNEDKVPLLVKFGQKYFGPIDKKNYFEKWKQYELQSKGVFKNDLKAALNKITRILNGINLQETGGTKNEYGDIEPTQGPDNPLKAKPRVSVKQSKSTDYNTVTHSTAKTGSIGYVYYSGKELEIVDGSGDGKKWSDSIEAEFKSETKATLIYNSLEAYYHLSDKICKTPLLIKITGAGRTNDLYYERANSTENLKWKKVTGSLIDDSITERVNQIFYNFNNSVKIELSNPGQKGYLGKFVKNGEASTPETGLGVGVTVTKDSCNIDTTYTCIKHTVSINSHDSSKVGGLRFYFGNHEVKTFKDSRGQTTMSVFYYQKKNHIHVYLQATTNVPLLFRYNKQCFRPHSKEDYFNKWVLETNVKTSHPSSTDLNTISEMLNEINLEKTVNGSGGDTQQYGLDKPKDATGLENFNGNRITVKRDKATSGKFGKIVHTTNNRLPIGKIMCGSKELTENDSSSTTLSKAAKAQTSVLDTIVNAVTVYYHKDDEGFTTPLLLGFGRISDTNAVVEPGSATAANPTVFYKRENRADVRKWAKAGLHDINDQKIASTLEEIRYELGKCIAIYIEKQHKGTGASEEYEVKVVDNKPGTSRSTGPQSISGFNQKIQVKKEDCPNTQSPESPSQPALEGYACYTHTIPDLKTATESQYIGGLKLYVCEKNQLQTFGVGGYLPEPIYYKSEQQTVTVYFYSSGHGPPRGGGDTSDPGTQKPDTVPLLVTYGGKYFSPKDRFTYFTSWDRVDVQESQGDTSAINHIATVLDKINKDLNSVQIDKTGDTDGTSSGYGLYNKDAFCSCSENNFCNRVSAQRDIKNVANYRKVIHSTTNKFRIGDVYHGSQKITAIKTTEVDGCNLLNVYYGPDDKDCKNPLLICLGQQTETNSVSEGTTNTQCKKWFKLKSINVTDWTEVSQEDISKYARDDSIKGELTQILEKFKDYLYLEIDNTSKYQPNVQHQTGDKKKVGDNKDENKIKVEEANGEAGSEETGDGVQVPKDYKGYKHELKDFYNRAKKEINTALKPQSTNLIPDSSGENTNPELQLRLQIAGQIITLVGQDAKTSLSDPPTLKPTDGDSGTTTANDPVVYFYKTGGGTSGGSSPDTVPLLFKFGKKYYRPLNRASYFQTWHQVMITEGESGNSDGLKEKIKNELDRINRELNEIDLTKTRSGTSRETDYGLEIPRGTTLTNSFSTKRIQVERQDKVLSGTTSFTYISHRTANKYNIGNIKQLGECQFDNTHTKTLGDKPIHNEAVAVYDKGDFTYKRPQLVLITESNSRGSGSTVKGYYDLSNGCASKITFKTVTGGFTVEDLGKREKMIGEKDLLPILQRIGILEKEQPPELLQASALDSSPGHDGSVSQEEGEDGPEEEDSLTGDGDGERDPAEGQDARSKAGVVPGGADGLRGTGAMGAGAKVPMGLSGPTGTRGNDGARGTEHQSTLQTQTETTASSSTHTTTTRSNGHVTQEQSRVDGDNSGSTNGGGTHTQSERGAQTSSGGGGGIFETHKTEIIAGGGGAGGVGVMATVGAVVYK